MFYHPIPVSIRLTREAEGAFRAVLHLEKQKNPISAQEIVSILETRGRHLLHPTPDCPQSDYDTRAFGSLELLSEGQSQNDPSVQDMRIVTVSESGGASKPTTSGATCNPIDHGETPAAINAPDAPSFTLFERLPDELQLMVRNAVLQLDQPIWSGIIMKNDLAINLANRKMYLESKKLFGMKSFVQDNVWKFKDEREAREVLNIGSSGRYHYVSTPGGPRLCTKGASGARSCEPYILPRQLQSWVRHLSLGVSLQLNHGLRDSFPAAILHHDGIQGFGINEYMLNHPIPRMSSDELGFQILGFQIQSSRLYRSDSFFNISWFPDLSKFLDLIDGTMELETLTLRFEGMLDYVNCLAYLKENHGGPNHYNWNLDAFFGKPLCELLKKLGPTVKDVELVVENVHNAGYTMYDRDNCRLGWDRKQDIQWAYENSLRIETESVAIWRDMVMPCVARCLAEMQD